MIQNKTKEQTTYPSIQTQSQSLEQDFPKLRLFVGPTLGSTTNSSIESYLLQGGLKVAVRDRKSKRKKKFVIVEVDEAGSTARVSDFINTYHFIDGQKMRIRKFRNPKKKTDLNLNRKIYVGNLPRDVTKDEVKKFFGRYGKISSVLLKKKSRKVDFAFAFVLFDSKIKADRLKALQILKFKNKTLYIKNADHKPQRGTGSMSDPQSSGHQGSSSDELNQPRSSESSQRDQDRRQSDTIVDSSAGSELDKERLRRENILQTITQQEVLKEFSMQGKSLNMKEQVADEEFMDMNSTPGGSLAYPLSSRYIDPAERGTWQVSHQSSGSDYSIRSTPADESLTKTDARRYDRSQEEYLRRKKQANSLSKNSGSFTQEGLSAERLKTGISSTRAGLYQQDSNSNICNNNNHPRLPQAFRAQPSGLELIPEINTDSDRFWEDTIIQESTHNLARQRGDIFGQEAGERGPSGSGIPRGYRVRFEGSWAQEPLQPDNNCYGMKPQVAHDFRRERASYAEIFSNNEPRVGYDTNYEGFEPAGITRRDSSRPHFWRYFTDANQQEQMILEDRQIAHSDHADSQSEDGTLKQLLASVKLRRISISHLQKGNMRFNIRLGHRRRTTAPEQNQPR